MVTDLVTENLPKRYQTHKKDETRELPSRVGSREGGRLRADGP